MKIFIAEVLYAFMAAPVETIACDVISTQPGSQALTSMEKASYLKQHVILSTYTKGGFGELLFVGIKIWSCLYSSILSFGTLLWKEGVQFMAVVSYEVWNTLHVKESLLCVQFLPY